MITQRFSLIVVLSVAAVVGGFFAYALLGSSWTISNNGNVKAVGVCVYWESGCVNEVSSINWGYLEPGATHDVTVFVANEGNVPVTLSMTTDNWNPGAATYITVSWNREGYVLDAGAVAETVITLSVSDEISDVTSFSFDIAIVGTE